MIVLGSYYTFQIAGDTSNTLRRIYYRTSAVQNAYSRLSCKKKASPAYTTLNVEPRKNVILLAGMLEKTRSYQC